MKKILIIIAVLVSAVSYSQTPPGYTLINSRYDWLAGLFKALGLPAGSGPAAFTTGQAQRAGAVYMDTLGSDKGLYIYLDGMWQLVGGGSSQSQQTVLISGGSVFQEGPDSFNFGVASAFYLINGVPYTSDSVSFVIDSAHATLDRRDLFYLDATGAHVREGTPSEAPLVPQTSGDEIALTSVSIDAGTTAPTLSSIIVYDENTESVVTNFGTTTNGASTNSIFRGTVAMENSNIINGEYVDFTKTSGTWDIAGVDAVTLFIDLKAQMPTLANLRISLWNGTSQVSGEVILGINKNSTVYQGISIPISAFGNITNTLIDKVRIRYTSNNANNYTGFFLDYIHFIDGLSQPSQGGNISITLNMPSSFTVSPTNTIANNGVWNVTMNGNASQYVRGDGSLATFNGITTVGTVNSETKSPNGAVINGVNLVLQDADASNRGLFTAELYRVLDSLRQQTAENIGNGDSIMVRLAWNQIAFKTIVFDDHYGTTDSTIHLDTTAAVGGGFFSPNQTATGNTVHTVDVDEGHSFSLEIVKPTFSITSRFTSTDNGEVAMLTSGAFGDAGIVVGSPGIGFNSDLGVYGFSNIPDFTDSTDTKVLVWDSAHNVIGAIPASELGGGSGVTTVGSFGSTPTANGAIISGNTITFQPASGTHPGMVIVGDGLGMASGVLSSTPRARINTSGSTFQAGRLNFIAGTGISLGISGASGDVDITIDATGGSGASTSLNNLASVAINTSLISDADNTDDLGSSSIGWKDIYSRTLKLDGATSGTITLDATAVAGTNTITFPASTGTVALTSNSSITKGFMTDALTVNSITTIIPRYIFNDEFTGANSNSAGSTYLLELVSGTGANASQSATPASITGGTGFGYGVIESGTTTTGKAVFGGYGATNANALGKVDNDYYYRVSFKNVIFNDLSDGTETYKTFMGFGVDNATTNGIYFTYTNSENSGALICTSHNNMTAENTNTATTVAADTEYDLDIEFYNQTAKFYINGTLVATHTTQVPAAASTMQNVMFKILKSAGSTNRQVFVDAVGLRITHENDL